MWVKIPCRIISANLPLSTHLDTDLIDGLDKMGFKDKREVVNICFSKGITIANKYSNPWVRIQPDVLQAKNNFVTLYSLIEKKYKVIFYPMGFDPIINLYLSTS